MTTVQQLLDKKGHEVLSVHPDDTVFDAIKKMADNDVGSVVVIEDDRPAGIFTERQYARNVILKGRSSPMTSVRDVMEKRVVCVHPRQTVDECMAVMTDKRIRHLPVLDHKKLVGIVSIGDLVKSKIADQEFTIERLVEYVRG
ncbi:MAG: CBS domain-containing protein [Alphaproteobacteria bacterium]|nr:CBS domain-containing protein [Alphaproteobacteria bacterium]